MLAFCEQKEKIVSFWRHFLDCGGSLICSGHIGKSVGVTQSGRGSQVGYCPASAQSERQDDLPDAVQPLRSDPRQAAARRTATELERGSESRRGKWASRAGLIRAALLIAVAVLPGGPSYAAPSEPARREILEARRVAEVRERLERRRALQRNLQVQLETLAAQIEALRARQEQTSAAVLSERQQARGLEQQSTG